MLRGYGQKLQHVKFHGALSSDVAYDARIGEVVVEALRRFDRTIILVLPVGSPLVEVARRRGLRVAEEGFMDRAYDRAGRLVGRDDPQALVTDPSEAARRMVEMVTRGEVTTVEGKRIPLRAQTFCLHSDTPHAGAIAAAVATALRTAGVAIRPLGEIVS
jgi:UPF0271 protein